MLYRIQVFTKEVGIVRLYRSKFDYIKIFIRGLRGITINN